MANANYTKEALAGFLLLEDSVKAGQLLRQKFPPQVLYNKGEVYCQGYYDFCPGCGTKIYSKFGDFSKPLDEHWSDCPISEGTGHGVWASAINVALN